MMTEVDSPSVIPSMAGIQALFRFRSKREAERWVSLALNPSYTGIAAQRAVGN
jgi:hypothetical protein